MARYKAIDTSPKFLAVDLEKQLLPGSFEYAVHHLLDQEFDLSLFDSRYRNDQSGASAYPPGMLLRVILCAYAQLFAQVLYLCNRQGLIGREMFAIDGVKLPSNASKAKSGTRADLNIKLTNSKLPPARCWLDIARMIVRTGKAGSRPQS